MASAIDVAAFILERVGNVTTMKLQKLVYYSQVRYLVQKENRCSETIFRLGRMVLCLLIYFTRMLGST